MGYNPFRWYTSGKYRKKPLKSNAPLLLKIRNGDFEHSPFFREAKDKGKTTQQAAREAGVSDKVANELSGEQMKPADASLGAGPQNKGGLIQRPKRKNKK